MLRSVCLKFLAATVLLALPAHAAPMPARYRAPLEKMFDAAQAPGMVAMIVAGDDVMVQGFGRTSPSDPSPPNDRTLVRLNSLSKLMAAEVLASLVEARAIRLDDTLQAHAPAGGRVPTQRGAQQITIRDLVSHTSGLLRDVPPSVWSSASPRAARWDWLARSRPLHAPGQVAEYSNAAWLFLGDAMEQATHDTYPALLTRIVTRPLQLADTTLAPSPAQCARLMAPDRAPCDSMGPMAPSWGVYSTPADVARWQQALWAAAPGTAMNRSLLGLTSRGDLKEMRGLDFAGEAKAIGWGWLQMDMEGRLVLQKTGGGGRTMNYLIMSPSEKRALFITVARMDIDMLRQLTRRANLLMADILHDTF